ncbi:MAG: phosphate transport system ATP-binding protein, partial [Actinomycetota bacterium]
MNTSEVGKQMQGKNTLADIALSRASNNVKGNVIAKDMEAVGIHAWFGKKHVLADVNLNFPAGSVTALIGPSGC